MSLIAASLIALATTPVATTPPEASEEPRHLMGAAASYALDSRSVGQLPAASYPTYYGLSAWYGYRLGGPLHVGLVGDANALAGSVSILLEVYGSIGPYLDVGLGLASGPTWYWQDRLETLKNPGGLIDVHGEVLGRITPFFSLGARIGFVLNSFDVKEGVPASDETSNYFWAFPAGLIANVRL